MHTDGLFGDLLHVASSSAHSSDQALLSMDHRVTNDNIGSLPGMQCVTGCFQCLALSSQDLYPLYCMLCCLPASSQGVIINGCIRDSEDIAKMPLGVKALGTYPLKSSKRDPGLFDVPVTIAGVTVHPGDWVYADKGGCGLYCQAACCAVQAAVGSVNEMLTEGITQSACDKQIMARQ